MESQVEAIGEQAPQHLVVFLQSGGLFRLRLNVEAIAVYPSGASDLIGFEAICRSDV